MKKLLFGWFFIIILGAFSLYSQSEYDDLFADLSDDVSDFNRSTSKKKLSNLGLKFSLLGDHIFEFHIPVVKDEIDFEGYIKSPKFRNDIGLEIEFKQVKLVSHWQFDLILNQWGSLSEFIEIFPLENYISWTPYKFIINLGFQKFNWGTADGINPTDNLNLRDLRKPVDPKKISVFSMYTGFFPARFVSLEVVYIPFYISFIDSPVYIVKSVYSGASVSTKEVKIKPEHFGLGGKVSFFLRYADFSVSYLSLIDPYSSMEMELEKVINGPVEYYTVDKVLLYNRRLHHFGTDVKFNVNIFSIWAELCYTMTEDLLMDQYDIRNHQLRWTVGFDFNYGPKSEFYFNLQYFGQYNPLFYDDLYNDYENGEPALNKSKEYYKEYYYNLLTERLGGVAEGFNNGISLEMNWPVLNKKLTPSLKVMYSIPFIYDTNREIRYGNIYINPELNIMPFETFNILIGSEVFLSFHEFEGVLQMNENTLIGSNYQSSNFYIEVEYKWGLDVYR